MAKLAVLISSPSTYTTHCPKFFEPFGPGNPAGGWKELDGQGVVLSDNNTPFPRANSSNVIGINEPVNRLLVNLFSFLIYNQPRYHVIQTAARSDPI